MLRLFISLAVAACVLAATAVFRNDIFEFCTTRAYGFPFPWYMSYCECEQGAPVFEPVFYFGNFCAAFVIAVAMTKIWNDSSSKRSIPDTK